MLIDQMAVTNEPNIVITIRLRLYQLYIMQALVLGMGSKLQQF